MRRLSTHTFARRVAPLLENGPALLHALNLPLAADIFATLDAHRAARFFILGCVQSVKSATGQLKLLRDHWADPGPSAWYAPTKAFLNSFADDKFSPLKEAAFESPKSPFYGIAPADRPPTKYAARYLTGSHRLLSAETENDRTGKTLRDLYLDEVHLWQYGWIEQISNRRASFAETADWIEVLMSTGLTRGAGPDAPLGAEAAAIWDTTDQRTWHVRCPACNKLHEPRYLHRERDDDPESPIIGGLIYTRATLDNGLPDETALAASLRYQCPRCRAQLPDSAASRIALSGTAAAPRGLYIALNSHPAPRTFGWTFNAIAIRPWLPIVIKFERAQLARTRGDLEPLGRFIREELGGIFDPEKYLRAQRAEPLGLTPYKLGDDWPEEAVDYLNRPVRFCTCDVQIDRFIYVIRMWSKDGRSRLRACGIVSNPGALRDACMAHNVIPDRVYLDGRHDPQYVKRIAAINGWRVMMGEKDKDYYHSATGLRRIFSEPRAEDAFAGTAMGRGTVLVVMFSKQSALSRLNILRTTPTNDGDLRWTIASDAPDWYKKEINAHYRKKHTAPDGQEYYVWEGWKEDHAGDDEAMQTVCASMAGLVGSESLETDATTRPASPTPAAASA